MDKNLDNAKIKDYLEKSGFLIQDGYGPGIPVFLPKGIEVINCFTQLFENNLQRFQIKLNYFDCKQLVLREDFQTLYSEVKDYGKEVLSFNDKLLMSDPLAQTLKKIKNSNGEVGLLSISSIFRDKSRGLIPLFKDRNIYPVVQLDQGVYSANFIFNLEELKRMYQSFYKLLGIKICFLEAAEVLEYASYELYFLSTFDNKFTKLGMIYQLSKQFNKNYQMTSDITLLNSGFSGKSLFMCIKNFSESYKIMALPPYLTDNLVYLTFDNIKGREKIEEKFCQYNINYISKTHAKNSYQIWKNSATFYFVYVHKFYTLYERSGKVNEFQKLDELLEYINNNLKEVVNESFNYSKQKLKDNLANKTENKCLNCWDKSYYGTILLEQEIECESCGKMIDRIIFIEDPNNRFY